MNPKLTAENITGERANALKERLPGSVAKIHRMMHDANAHKNKLNEAIKDLGFFATLQEQAINTDTENLIAAYNDARHKQQLGLNPDGDAEGLDYDWNEYLDLLNERIIRNKQMQKGLDAEVLSETKRIKADITAINKRLRDISSKTGSLPELSKKVAKYPNFQMNEELIRLRAMEQERPIYRQTAKSVERELQQKITKTVSDNRPKKILVEQYLKNAQEEQYRLRKEFERKQDRTEMTTAAKAARKGYSRNKGMATTSIQNLFDEEDAAITARREMNRKLSQAPRNPNQPTSDAPQLLLDKVRRDHDEALLDLEDIRAKLVIDKDFQEALVPPNTVSDTYIADAERSSLRAQEKERTAQKTNQTVLEQIASVPSASEGTKFNQLMLENYEKPRAKFNQLTLENYDKDDDVIIYPDNSEVEYEDDGRMLFRDSEGDVQKFGPMEILPGTSEGYRGKSDVDRLINYSKKMTNNMSSAAKKKFKQIARWVNKKFNVNIKHGSRLVPVDDGLYGEHEWVDKEEPLFDVIKHYILYLEKIPNKSPLDDWDDNDFGGKPTWYELLKDNAVEMFRNVTGRIPINNKELANMLTNALRSSKQMLSNLIPSKNLLSNASNYISHVTDFSWIGRLKDYIGMLPQNLSYYKDMGKHYVDYAINAAPQALSDLWSNISELIKKEGPDIAKGLLVAALLSLGTYAAKKAFDYVFPAEAETMPEQNKLPPSDEKQDKKLSDIDIKMLIELLKKPEAPGEDHSMYIKNKIDTLLRAKIDQSMDWEGYNRNRLESSIRYGY